MAGGGWTMVFKAVTEDNQIAYQSFKSSETYAENELAALDVTNQYPNDYKNRIVLNWCTFGASEARVVLYKGVNPVKQLIFNATGTDNLNWFQFDKLMENPWTDTATQPRNLFTIQDPDTALQRSFIINSVYSGCPNDIGWMMISGTYCSYERPQNTILYSKESVRTNWNNDGKVEVADTMVVFLR